MLYSAGLSVLEVAEGLQAHCETISADLPAFDHAGIAGILHFDKRGAPKRILESQSAALLRVARIPPDEVGLPSGRGSLAKVRTSLIKRRVVKTLSREHRRRVLKKGAWPFIVSNANCSVTSRNAKRSYAGAALSGGSCPRRGGWSFLMSNRLRSRPMVGAARAVPKKGSWSGGKTSKAASICSGSMR